MVSIFANGEVLGRPFKRLGPHDLHATYQVGPTALLFTYVYILCMHAVCTYICISFNDKFFKTSPQPKFNNEPIITCKLYLIIKKYEPYSH